MQDQVLGTGADADFWAPDAQAGTHVILRTPPPVMSPGLLVQGIRHPGKGPHLSPVGMPAELKVNTGRLGLFQMVGLMVQQDGEAFRRDG